MTGNVLLPAIGVVVLALVLRPLLRRRGPAGPAPSAASERDAGDAVDTALQELEQDFAMGKLSAADYEALRAKQAGTARGSARSTPSAPHAAPDAGPVPARAAPRAPRVEAADRRAADLDRIAEELVRRYRRVRVRCRVCGERPEPDAVFCSNCGRCLVACAACGATNEEIGARFCPACGSPLAA
jgi:hypothetical protein